VPLLAKRLKFACDAWNPERTVPASCDQAEVVIACHHRRIPCARHTSSGPRIQCSGWSPRFLYWRP